MYDSPNNDPIKTYGMNYLLTNLKINDKVTYRGTPCEVKSVDEYSLILTSLENGKVITCNQAMFNQYGFIRG